MSEPVDPYTLGAMQSQLADHERRLTAINGSQAVTAAELVKIGLILQSLVDADKAREDRHAATEKALKDAQDYRWGTPTRLSIVLGGFCALAVLVLTVYLAFRHNTITQLPVKTTP